MLIYSVNSQAEQQLTDKNSFLVAKANYHINLTQNKLFTNEKLKQHFIAWELLIDANAEKSNLVKLKVVNDFFNKMTWVSDKMLWNKKDYWATPIESITRYAGDCDDFSIAKYFTLLALDIPVEHLRMNYVKLANQQSHMVVSYQPTKNKDPLILDNMNKSLVAKEQRNDLTFLFSFNSNNIWLANNKKLLIDGKHNINLWTNMMNRIEKEQS